MANLTQAEIDEIERQLNDPNFRGRLKKLQGIVQGVFEKFQERAETMTIRTVLPRKEIKELGRVIRKIETNREKNPSYSLIDVPDLVGIKVLCPYPSDVEIVIGQMRAEEGFDVFPKPNEKASDFKGREAEAREVKESGYLGFHYVIKLKEPKLAGNEDLMGLPCEVQIKTMLEEAWDAKTHDVTYIREEEDIDPALRAQMKLLSDALYVADQQSEIVKTQIQQEEEEERRRKKRVVEIWLAESAPVLQEIVSGYSLDQDILSGKFSEENIRSLLPAIRDYRKQGKISQGLCYVAALVAVHVRGRQLDTMALAVCDEFISRQRDEPRPYLTKGQVYWALDMLDVAIKTTESGIEKAQQKGDSRELSRGKGDFAYWVGEKAWKAWRERGKEIPAELEEKANAYIESAINLSPGELGLQDTKAFLFIVSGSDIPKIKEGLDLDYAIWKKSGGSSLADGFCRRHERIALRRILEKME